MNLTTAIRFYIKKLCDESGPGMKILLMDQETKSIVSIVYSQSEISTKEVYLFDLIENQNRESMKHLKCLCLLRPTRQNIQALIRELKDPRYGHYYLYFTNTVEKMDIKSLAENDEYELVREVQEYFADYLAVSQHVFSFNIPKCSYALKWNETHLKRTAQGLISLFLALKKSPVIRYQYSSDSCRKLAEMTRNMITKDSALFDFRQSEIAPLLLILDRREDPITPLLNQWTYQAMVNELIGIKNNIVNLSGVPGIAKELEEIVLSAEYDEFYENNMYSTFGEMCSNIKELMEEFQKYSRSQAKVESIADMKAFVENYPQFKKMSGTVAKHVTLVSELSRLVSTYNLMEVSETEQQLTCQDDHAEVLQKIRKLISDTRVKNTDILRLICLYALKYERSGTREVYGLRDAFNKRPNLDENEKDFVNKILMYGGLKFRETDLFGNQNTMAITKRLIKGLKGVENVYTQHVPLVRQIVDQLLKGKLKETAYPYLAVNGLKDRPQEVIVFVVGGITFEETCAIYNFNKTLGNSAKVIIGGTHVHNFKSFMDEVSSAVAGSGASSFSTARNT